LAAHGAGAARGNAGIGFLSFQSADVDFKDVTVRFLQGLKETGYVEGQNVAIERRYAENQFDRLPALAADLVRRQVAVIGASGNQAAVAAKTATTAIPIVFAVGGDPVSLGLVASLNRPGTNATGVANLSSEIAHAVQFGVLADPTYAGIQSLMADLQAAARILGAQLLVSNARTDSDLKAAFASFSQQRVGAVLVGNGVFYNRHAEQLVALAARHALPAIYPLREYALAGGLMSYGGSVGDLYQQAGVYTGRILNGDKPADLPVQKITKIQLVINVKTARALGLETLLATADEVIQNAGRSLRGSGARRRGRFAGAQQAKLPVIGHLNTQSADDDYKNFTVPFLQGLKDTGYVDGQNVAIDIVMRRTKLIGYRRLQPISFDAALRLSRPAAHPRRWRRK